MKENISITTFLLVPLMALVTLRHRTTSNPFSLRNHKLEDKHYHHFPENHTWASGHLKSIPLNESASVCSNCLKSVSYWSNSGKGGKHTPVGPKPNCFPPSDRGNAMSSLQRRQRKVSLWESPNTWCRTFHGARQTAKQRGFIPASQDVVIM